MSFPKVFFSCSLLATAMAAARGGEKIDFSREIQPLLAETCYQCHGPDEKAREAKLRLDTKEGAFKTDEDGLRIIVPGKPAESELVARIKSSDRDEVMPPPKSKRRLTPAQIELLTHWVEEGASWAQHWSFVSARRPPVPTTADYGARLADLAKRDAARAAELKNTEAAWKEWAQNPIDNFVLARLLSEGLTPSPEAPPEKLCRRVYLDLTGLPPSLEELDAYLQSAVRNPQSAFEKLVDQLLASPRYGERMVWEWLEAARYADTNGYQGDPTRAMWFWRDWAIKALNDNMPFDQFTIEQLAGDLLPHPTRDQLIATGFHRNHMINGEGGRIAEESRVEYVQDRVETTATVWMGLTLNCCRCHDHKFDPIRQREYYQLSAYFNSVEESGAPDAGGGLAKPILAMPTAAQEKNIAELEAAEELAKKTRDELEKKLRDEQPVWETTLRAKLSATEQVELTWHLLRPTDLVSEAGATLTKTEDGAVLASGANPAKDTFVLTIPTSLRGITAFKLEALPAASLANQGPGRADNGNYVLSEIKMQAGGKAVELVPLSADFEQGEDHRARTSFDNKPETGWAVMPQFGKPHTLLFAAKSPISKTDETLLSVRLECQSSHVSHVLGHFRISATTDDPALLQPTPDAIFAILSVPAEQRNDAQKKELSEYYLSTHTGLAAATQARDEAKKHREQAGKEVTSTMIMRDRSQPRDTFVLVKGAYDKIADKVGHGVPAVLPPLPADAPVNRLALAKWIVSPEHPLTARVAVNHAWQTFFGIGLVKTAEDFGVQGEKPSHPELLDWLAREFIDSGWNVKHIHRLIVTSAAYRQSAHVPAGLSERDPENRLLARGPRSRLPSWMLRDQALAVSGLLVEKLGGPPVKTYQPEGVWEDATFGQIRFTQDHGESLYRRSVYIFWRRIIAPTIFFDVANRQNCAVKVGRTNTPMHALVTLNDVTYVEAARALAERMLKHGGTTDDERLAFGFRLCTARFPTDAEKPLLLGSLARLREQYAGDPNGAKKVIAIGESKPDPKLDATELAAHTGVASLLLNLDETLNRE